MNFHTISPLTSSSLLLHTETPDGSVVPIWEEVNSDDVMVLKDVMAQRRHIAEGVELGYARIPITAERPPDFSDLSELIEVMIRCNTSETPIILNCQLGRGRSTLTAVSDPDQRVIHSHLMRSATGYSGADQAMACEGDSSTGPIDTETTEQIADGFVVDLHCG